MVHGAQIFCSMVIIDSQYYDNYNYIDQEAVRIERASI